MPDVGSPAQVTPNVRHNNMKQNKSGLTIIEIMAFTVLFAVGFIPGHLAAQRFGIFAGILLGALSAVAIMIAFGQLLSFITWMKAKLRKR